MTRREQRECRRQKAEGRKLAERLLLSAFCFLHSFQSCTRNLSWHSSHAFATRANCTSNAFQSRFAASCDSAALSRSSRALSDLNSSKRVQISGFAAERVLS